MGFQTRNIEINEEEKNVLFVYVLNFLNYPRRTIHLYITTMFVKWKFDNCILHFTMKFDTKNCTKYQHRLFEMNYSTPYIKPIQFLIFNINIIIDKNIWNVYNFPLFHKTVKDDITSIKFLDVNPNIN